MLYYICNAMQTSERQLNKAKQFGAIENESTTIGTTKQAFECFFLRLFESIILKKSINTVLLAQNGTSIFIIRITAVSRNCEFCGKFTFAFRKNFYL